MNTLPAKPESRLPSPSSTPPTSNNSPGPTETLNRRARRKKKRQANAGPSSSGSPIDSTNTQPEDIPQSSGSHSVQASSSRNGAQTQSDTFAEADFIAFDFGDESESEQSDGLSPKAKGKQRARDGDDEEPTTTRGWGGGKPKSRSDEREHAGRKRKVDDYDLDDGYANKKQRLDAASRKAPWVYDVDWDSCQNVAQLLHREVEAFVKYVSPTPEEDEIRSLIVAWVTRAIKQQYPDAEVLPFGSYETKLYLPLGDIDLVILSDQMAYSRTGTVLRALANTVKRAGLTDKVTIIDKAKVPIIKFITTHGRFSVDISINQRNGVAAGQIIKHFLRELPALRPLVLIIKTFLSQRSMNEVFSGGLGSYSIVCLAISFLQMHPKIRKGEIDPEKNLGVLVMEFFELYGCYFNYQEVGISLRDGGTYYNKARRGWLDYRSPYLLSIEDPGDPSNDISRGTYNILKVRTTLAGAHGIMTAAAYLQAGYMSARRSGRTVRLRDWSDPHERSVLSSVMGVTQETINHRKVVQEIYDSRVLHRLLGVEPRVPVTLDVKEPNGRDRASGSSGKAAAESVEIAWRTSSGEDLSDREDVPRREEEDKDESRYGIANVRVPKGQPPLKRRRMGRPSDAHTVYTSDASDEDEREDGELAAQLHIGPGDYDAHGVSDEEEEYDVDEPKGDPVKREKTRSYWLSKGIGE
ncbi:hypothetical protein K474DRAFT_1615191 [Panus rudis PR-1116 ss-1]|nr:hypothetical protein K474DRAFT_1615191 [Panus rudis PR-1116 ss-1]